MYLCILFAWGVVWVWTCRYRLLFHVFLSFMVHVCFQTNVECTSYDQLCDMAYGFDQSVLQNPDPMCACPNNETCPNNTTTDSSRVLRLEMLSEGRVDIRPKSWILVWIQFKQHIPLFRVCYVKVLQNIFWKKNVEGEPPPSLGHR